MLVMCIVYVLLCTISWVRAYKMPDFQIPPSWRKPTSNISVEDRELIAKDAVRSMLALTNTATGKVNDLEYQQSVNMLGAMALHDLITGNQTFSADVSNALGVLFTEIPNVSAYTASDVSPTMTLALASMYAYRAYHMQAFLWLATTLWNKQKQFMISVENAVQGFQPKAKVAVAKQCNKALMLGGVLSVNTASTDNYAHAATVGGFTALSAYLFEETRNDKYKQAAEHAATFASAQLFNGTVVVDHIDVHKCIRSENEARTYNSGLLIEGLSVLANVTGNVTLGKYLDETIAFAIHFSGWTGTDGINFEIERNATIRAQLAKSTHALVGLRSIFIRGLFEAWSRKDPTSQAAKLIEAYITVQFNALLDLASNTSNVYSPFWHGPPAPKILPWGHLAAIDTLNAAVGLTRPKILVDAPPDRNKTYWENMPAVNPPSSKKRTLEIVLSAILIPIIIVLASVITLCVRRHKPDRDRYNISQFTILGTPTAREYHYHHDKTVAVGITQSQNPTPGEPHVVLEAGLPIPQPVEVSSAQRVNEIRRETLTPLVQELRQILLRFSPSDAERVSLDPPPCYSRS